MCIFASMNCISLGDTITHSLTSQFYSIAICCMNLHIGLLTFCVLQFLHIEPSNCVIQVNFVNFNIIDGWLLYSIDSISP
jgi:hypothetical protein